MTREEAIEFGYMWLQINEDCKDSSTYAFFQMAIEAMQMEHCEDAISRSEAINSLDALYLDGESAQGYTTDANEDCLIGKYKAIEILDELPSVNPQKVGKWRRKIVDGGYNADWICSSCGYKEMTDFPTKFCPNCGAKMEEGRGECMTYLDLLVRADNQIDNGSITLEEYNNMIAPLRQEVQAVQPEQKVKPISYQDCANAMLMMWIDKVLTDGEYYRIMDKLNAHEKKMKEGE